MKSMRKFAEHLAVILFALAFCLPATSEAKTFYQATVIKSSDLKNLLGSGFKINNLGQIVGGSFLWSPDKGLQYTGELYSGTLPVDSKVLYDHSIKGSIEDGLRGLVLSGINDRGQIIAYHTARSYLVSEYAIFSFLLEPNGSIRYLGYFYGYYRNLAHAINNAGQIIGTSYKGSIYDPYQAFMVTSGGNMQFLFPDIALNYLSLAKISAKAINDKGQIIGNYNSYFNFLFDMNSGVLSEVRRHQDSLDSLVDINNVEQIIGFSPPFYSSGSRTWGRPFIFRSLSHSRLEFEYLLPEGTIGTPFDINNLGYVVGSYVIDNRPDSPQTTGFIWYNNKLEKINDLIHPSDPLKPSLHIIEAHGINDKGQIVAIGYHDRGAISDCSTSFSDKYVCSSIILLTPTTLSTSLAIDLLDPVPALLEGSTVSTNPETLAKKGRIVEGVGADGVATLVLRIHASSVGESVTLTLDGTSTDEAGALGVLGATPDALTTTVTAESTTEGPMAFALYRAPVDFAWKESHHSLQRRSVTLSASSSSGGSATKSIDVIRPPVVLVHGLWGDSDNWSEFTPLINNKTFDIYKFDYKTTNAEAVATNSKKLLDAMHLIVGTSSDVNNVAIAQGDLVAHSMGGLIARSLPVHKDDYLSKRNFNKGYVHKLITIGTPHLGSPLARELIKPENACLVPIFNDRGMVINVNGAVGDLKGDGDGNGLSDALKKLQKLPIAMLAGRLAPTQIEGLSLTKKWYFSYYCEPNAPLVDKFKPENYSSLMGGYHDGIVPLASAINKQNGEAWGDGLKEEGGLHSKGTMALGFSGPYLLQSDSMVSRKVIDLLNAPVTSTEFIKP